MAIRLLVLGVLLFLLPLLTGGIFADMGERAEGLLFRWVSGQFCLWGGFQLICVPFVLLEKEFSYVVVLFSLYGAVTAALGLARMIVRRRKTAGPGEPRPAGGPGKISPASVLLWTVFAALLLFQLAQAVRMTYMDGDDAYYVALSASVNDSGLMYGKLPYTGRATGLDVRHALAPLPVWISYLAELTGTRTVIMAHVLLPVFLIAFAYAVFYLLGRRLLPEKGTKLPLFLIFTELLVLFGDYSICTVENFLIARSRQGKAALGSIVIPFLFVLLLMWLERQEARERSAVRFYVLIAMVMLTGCLCSTMGALLVCLLTGIVGLLGAAVHKRWLQALPLALCAVPCAFYAVLYIL